MKTTLVNSMKVGGEFVNKWDKRFNLTSKLLYQLLFKMIIWTPD
jgi:hypothetical protein